MTTRALNPRWVKNMEDAEAGYGMSFWDVVRGFASDGESRQTTAIILGFNRLEALKRLEQRFGVVIDWPSRNNCNALRAKK